MAKNFIFFKPPGPIKEVVKDLKTKPPAFWERKGEAMALKLFAFASQKVPAYKQFLKEQGIKPERIKTIKDFQKLPSIDKDSYLRKYPYLNLFPGAKLSGATTISGTSGSTGEPFYFPRGKVQDLIYRYQAEIFLRDQFEIDRKKTLGIISFGLGIWIGGIFTYKNFNQLAEQGYPLTLIPIGTHKDLFLKSVKKFGRFFDQVILMGIPTMIKDIIDEAKDFGVDWRDYRLKILMATEGFSEKFRDYLCRKTFIKNPLEDTLNIYGSVELGTMAHETALTNLIRKIVVEKPPVFQKLFGQASRLPTLAQYHPYLIRFETVGQELVASGWGSLMPLIRYRLPDMGGVIGFAEMLEKLKSCGIDVLKEAKKQRIDKKTLKLPFVYVYERSDFATHFVGMIIYPEYFRLILHEKPIEEFVSGKLSLKTRYDKKQNQILEIHVELKKGVKPKPKLENLIEEAAVKALLKRSTEYQHLCATGSPEYRQQIRPKIFLHAYEDPLYFKPGGKPRWLIK